MRKAGDNSSTVEPSDDAKNSSKSKMATNASLNSAVTIKTYQGNLLGKDVELADVFEKVADIAIKIKGGTLFKLEEMLIGQAMALETMFTSLAYRAHNQERVAHIESFLQSRATISALVDLKFPRQVMFTKQANIANGPQQINNGVNADSGPARAGTRARTKEKQNSTNKLSGETHELLQDSRTSSTTIESNSDLAAVGKVHRTKVRRG